MLDAYKKSVNDVFNSVKKQNDELNNSIVVDLPEIKNNRTIEQQDNRTTEQVIEQVPEQVIEQVPEQVIEQQDNRATEQQNNQQSNRTTTQQSKQQPNRTTTQQNNRTTTQQSNQQDNRTTHNLTHKQFSILEYIYFHRPFKVKGENGISTILNIKYPTVRNNLMSLITKGYIEKPFYFNDGLFVGSNCRVNTERCIKLFGVTNIEQPDNRATEQQSDQQSNKATGHLINRTTEQSPEQQGNKTIEQQTGQRNNSYNSSSSFKKPTTKLNNYNLPEFQFWLEIGVTDKQISGWMDEFGLEDFSILNSLRYAEFDLVDNKKIDNVPNPAGWIYKTLKKNHSYNKPNNYKSYTEKICENEQREYEREKAEYEKLKKIREDRENLKQNMAFEKMLADPEGELYNKCFNNIPETFKKLYAKKEKRTGKTFYKRLKTEFSKLED